MGARSYMALASGYLRGLNWRWHIPFLITLSALTMVLFWGYLSGPLPTGTDSEGLVMTVEMGLKNGGLFSSWEPYSALGFQNDPLPLPSAIFAALSWLGLSTYDICKLIMVSSFWLAGALMYVCALKVSGSYLGSSCAAVIFSFNQVFLSQIMEGHYFFVIGFALLPLVFLVLHLAISKEDRRAIVLLPIVFFIYGGSAAPHMVLILSIFIIAYTGLYFGLNRNRLHRLLYPLVGLFILVLPTALSRFSSGTGIYNASYRLSEARIWSNQGLLDALATTSTENSHLRGAAIQSWFPIGGLEEAMAIVALLIPLLAILSLFFPRNRNLKIVLAGTGVVMLFFAMGPNQLLSDLFIWMFHEISLLDSIRVFSRFGMFLGLIYALLISMLIADLREHPMLTIRLPRLPPFRVRSAGRAVAAVVISTMLAASSTVFIQGPGSFPLPQSYSEPYELISTMDGDFRILTLPYGTVYYDTQLPRLDGYPSTLTNDPGTYSQIITGKEVAYGDHTEEYWSVWGTAVSEHTYGYRLLPLLLGDTAGVKYVVSQVHASPEELQDCLNMTGLEIYEVLPKGSTVLVNDYYQDRIHAASGLVISTDGRAAILNSLATGALDLQEDDLVLWSQVADNHTREVLWNAADKVIIHGGDLLELLVENGAWDEGSLIHLADVVDPAAEDGDRDWISSDQFIKEGSVLYPSAYTQGNNVLNVPVKVEKGGEHDLFIRVRVGPDSGNLTVAVGGSEPVAIDTRSPMATDVWVKVGTYDLSASKVDVRIASDGSGWCSANDLLMVEHGEAQRKMSELADSLASTSKTISYVYGPQDLAAIASPSWEVSEGDEGKGLRYNGTETDPAALLVHTNMPKGGDWTVTLRTMEGEGSEPSDAPYLIIDGLRINGTALGDGAYAFETQIEKGERSIEIHSSSIYSVALRSAGEGTSGSTLGDVEVSYERTEPWQYVVDVNTTRPIFLKMGEGYSAQWSVEGGDGKVLQYRSSSLTNGFYITEAGNYSLTITFEWQERYELNQIIIACITAAVTAVMWSFVWWRGRRGRKNSVSNI